MIATSTNTAVYGGLEYARGLNLPSGTIVGHGRIPITIMSTSTTNWASSISHHLRTAKKLLQETVFNAKYVWSYRICRVGGLTLELPALRRPSTKPRLG